MVLPQEVFENCRDILDHCNIGGPHWQTVGRLGYLTSHSQDVTQPCTPKVLSHPVGLSMPSRHSWNQNLTPMGPQFGVLRCKPCAKDSRASGLFEAGPQDHYSGPGRAREGSGPWVCQQAC